MTVCPCYIFLVSVCTHLVLVSVCTHLVLVCTTPPLTEHHHVPNPLTSRSRPWPLLCVLWCHGVVPLHGSRITLHQQVHPPTPAASSVAAGCGALPWQPLLLLWQVPVPADAPTPDRPPAPCPVVQCHGSHFSCYGKLIQGPAKADLDPVDW